MDLNTVKLGDIYSDGIVDFEVTTVDRISGYVQCKSLANGRLCSLMANDWAMYGYKLKAATPQGPAPTIVQSQQGLAQQAQAIGGIGAGFHPGPPQIIQVVIKLESEPPKKTRKQVSYNG